MSEFVGRTREIAVLDGYLAEARTGNGVLVSVRGRRQVGKSRLVAEFVARAGAPVVFFTASRRPPNVELALFAEAVTQSGVQAGVALESAVASSWEAGLSLATQGAAPGRPIVVVIDELPYLVETEPAIEAILQKIWQTLEGRAVLLVLIGSDVSMMESLSSYGRPLYGRAREMIVRPLSVAEVAQMRDLTPDAALDAYLVVGGFPRLAARWRPRDSVASFLRRELADESSPLVVTGERTMAAEFPAEINARAVLSAIGAGERVYGAIADRSGVGRTTIDRALTLLADKRVVRKTTPYAQPPGSSSRYAIVDPYLRFWHRFVEPAVEQIARGQADLAVSRIVEGWSTYRGRAIEQLIRDTVERMLPDERLGSARFVGSYWTRDNRVEVDLVGGERQERAGSVSFVGSIKWRDRAPFDRHDLRSLRVARQHVPGTGPQTRLVGVSRSGFTTDGLDLALDPAALVAAWDPRR